jgi:DNA-binding NtrC family response regulator
MPSPRVLVVSAETTSSQNNFDARGLPGYEITFAVGLEAALGHLRSAAFDILFASFPIPGLSAEQLLEEVQAIDPLIQVIIRDPEAELMDAVRLAHLGAYQCVGSDVESDRLLRYWDGALEERSRREQALFGPSQASEPWRRFLIGESRSIHDVLRVIRLVSSRKCTVLINGETGTGKEMVARALHTASPRAHLPMVAINCSAIPENLLEAELFGHVKGAFTGAVNSRIGRFEQANKGTIFLDEIGDMPLDLQAKLLRVLQEREIQRVGSSETIRVDIRVIAASNVDLLERVSQKKFREDLYYRLNVVPIHVPSLRERLTDVPLLVSHFIDKACRAEGIPAKRVGPGVIQRLCAQPWPGNVRQLENSVEMAVAISGDRTVLYPADFNLGTTPRIEPASVGTNDRFELPDHGLDFDHEVGRFERSILEQALKKAGGNKTVAADLLHLKRTTLLAKLRNLEQGEALPVNA